MAKKSFISGAIILMLAGFIVRILGFVYRIYLSNLIGAEGMGLFSLIFPVYSLIVLTLSAGVTTAVSKMVAAELAQNHPVNLRRITRCGLAFVICLGIAVSVLMYFNADFIAKVILKDERTYLSLLMLVPCIPAIAAASALKGYFYGIQDVSPTAVSQIVEQLVRMALVFGAAAYFLKMGLEYACALATLGMALGEIANLVVLFIVYRFKRKKEAAGKSRTGFIRKRIIFREIIGVTVPISFNRFITSAMSAVELILIPRRLLAGGLDYQSSIAEFGKLSGMVMPLINFPSLVTMSLATTLVPAIAEAVSLKRFKTVNYRISKSIQITFIIGFIFTALFINFPDQIGSFLYKKEDIGSMLYLLAFTCVFMYLQQTLLGIMNGLGKQGVSLRNSIIGSAIRIGFVYYCIPGYGIRGYVWGIILSTACVCVLNLYTVIKTTGMILDFRNWIVKPGLVGAAMITTGKYFYQFLNVLYPDSRWNMVITVPAYIGISLVFMVGIGALEMEEMQRMIGVKNRGIARKRVP